MTFAEIIKDIQNWFHGLVADLKPALDYVEANGGKDILILAETVLVGVEANTPWATLIANLIAAAEANGKTLATGAASIILNMAKANLDAKNAVSA